MPAEESPKIGRPSSYSPELAQKILGRLADGETLKGICREAGMPSDATVRGWALEDRDGFAERYARARDLGLDAVAEDLFEISDDGRNDWMESNDPENPGWRFNGEHVQRSKLRVDTRKWYLAKLASKRYGDRVDVGVGADNAPGFRVTIRSVLDDKDQ